MLFFFLLLGLWGGGWVAVTVPVCTHQATNGSSQIYCGGRILEAMNYHRVGLDPVTDDSKYFVDRPLKDSPDVIIAAFNTEFGSTSVPNMDPAKLAAFVTKYFDLPHSELSACTLGEWKPEPGTIMAIRDPALRTWALQIHGIWRDLCRQMNESVLAQPERHSLLYVPNPFVAPGGRFQEFYYWDTYWIIKGLLVSELYNTTKGMLLNFKHIFEKYKIIPNGGRVYYLARSQPPLLAPMVYEYYTATRDIALVRDMLPTLHAEIQWWNSSRRFTLTGPGGKSFSAFQYNSPSNVPRPESYKEDVASAAPFTDPTQKQRVYGDLASACESGWDFSSRWLSHDWKKDNVTSIRTTKKFPVDLNAILCWNMEILQLFYSITGDVVSADSYEYQRGVFRDTFHDIFFNKTEKAWFDWDSGSNSHDLRFYPSTAMPLFTNCYQHLNIFRPEDIFDYMKVGE